MPIEQEKEEGPTTVFTFLEMQHPTATGEARATPGMSKEVAGYESLQEVGPLINNWLHEPCMQCCQGGQVFLEATHRLV